jgi:murein DD-endopeptidase MepM/ murein hydrolase activator NlpD
VRVGQRVKRGAQIAAIGASGSSMFPHLHYELQTGIDTNVEGLPSTFTDFVRVQGSRRIEVKAGGVDSGEIVEGR